MFKKSFAALAFAAVAGVSVPASADVVTSLNLQFASGAVFIGTVTFTDGYGALIDVNGTLSGGSYAVTQFGWTWWQGTNQTNPFDYDGDASTYEDLLMTGNSAPAFSDFIGISWFHGGGAPVLNLNPNPVPGQNYWNSVNSTGDRIVAGAFGNAVPEPASLALVGMALVAAAGASRRRAATR